jgi:hypothetical protein
MPLIPFIFVTETNDLTVLNPYKMGLRSFQINNYQLFIVNYQFIGDRR